MVNSQAYEAFLKSLHRGPAQGALTYDQSALEALSASERKLAESLLIERVSSERDCIAMVTLGELGSVRAVEVLQQAAQEDDVEVRSAALRSLVAIKKDPDHVRQLGELLKTSSGAVSDAFVAYQMANSASPLSSSCTCCRIRSLFYKIVVQAVSKLCTQNRAA